MSKLDGKVCVITGGAGGIGEASAKLLVEEGARVVLGDLRDAPGEALCRELGDSLAAYVHTDVRQESDIRALIDLALERFGRLDVMINNAGSTGAQGSVCDVETKAFDDTIAVLLRSVFLGTKHAARAFQRQRTGSIVNVASVAGLLAGYGPHVYSAAKAAVIQLTRSVAMELAREGVRVNCLCPGGISTPIFGEALGLSPEAMESKRTLLNAALGGMVPMGRAGRADEAARAILWLASDDSSFVTGQALVVDGGMSSGVSWREMENQVARLRSVLGTE